MTVKQFTPIFDRFKNLAQQTAGVDIDSHLGNWEELAKRSSVSEMEDQLGNLLRQSAEGLLNVKNPATFQVVNDFLSGIGELEPSVAQQLKNIRAINDQTARNTQLANLLSSWNVQQFFTQGMLRYLKNEREAQSTKKTLSPTNRVYEDAMKAVEEFSTDSQALADRAVYEPGAMFIKYLFNLAFVMRDMIWAELGLNVPSRNTGKKHSKLKDLPLDIRNQLEGGAPPPKPKP